MGREGYWALQFGFKGFRCLGWFRFFLGLSLFQVFGFKSKVSIWVLGVLGFRYWIRQFGLGLR